MAFGVADFTAGVTYSIPDRTNGLDSFRKAELMGLLAAIMALPPRQDILVRLDIKGVLDNKGVVTKF